MNSVEVIPVGRLRGRLQAHERLLVEPGQTVRELLSSLGLRSDSAVMVMVNGHRVPKSYSLKTGDRVKLLPLIAGG